MESLEVNPKIQLNRQLFPKIKLAYATNPYGLHQNNAMKSDLTRAFPVKFKFKNPLAFSEHNKISPLQLTNVFSPNLVENDQANRMFEVNNADLNVPNNPEPPDNTENKRMV